jgi:hypothetical protein
LNRWGPPIPGWILLGFVAVTGVLLVAGFGVPVGVGLLAGLVLGGVVGLFFGIWVGVRGRDRSFSFGNFTSLTESPDFEVPEAFRDQERVQGVDNSPLTRVIAGGVAAQGGGVHLELIALEIRSAGGILLMAATTEPPIGFLGSLARVAVEDDLGTNYVAASMGSGGSADRMRFEVRFAPAPPVAAAVLRLRVDDFFDPFPVRSLAPVTGPWLLAMDLATSA